jgi:hypothetical protein
MATNNWLDRGKIFGAIEKNDANQSLTVNFTEGLATSI